MHTYETSYDKHDDSGSSLTFCIFPSHFQDIDEVTINYPTIYELMYDLKGKLIIVHFLCVHYVQFIFFC